MLDVHDIIVITDFFVICSAGTQRQMQHRDRRGRNRRCEAWGSSRCGARASPKPAGGCSTTSTSWCTCSATKSAPTTTWNGSGATRPGSSGSRRTQPPRLGRIVAQGPIAQLVERLAGSQEVRGSNPLGSTERGAPPGTTNNSSAPFRAGLSAVKGLRTSCQRQTIARRGEWANVRAGNESAKDPGSSSRHLAQLLDGLPVTDRRLDVAGTSTPVLEGGTGAPIILLARDRGVRGGMGLRRPEAGEQPSGRRSRSARPRSFATGERHAGRDLSRGMAPPVIDTTCDEPPALVGHSWEEASLPASRSHTRTRSGVSSSKTRLRRPFPPGAGLGHGDRALRRPSHQGKPRSVPPAGPVRSWTRRRRNGVIDGPRRRATTSSSQATRL